MILITIKGSFGDYSNSNKKLNCFDKNYIISVEYIKNKFNEILIKQVCKNRFFIENEKEETHNPIGPAIQSYYDNGSLHFREYRYNSKRHRLNGPAYQKFDKNGNLVQEEYWVDDKLHRLDGPAVIEYDPNGDVEFAQDFIYGNHVYEKDFKKAK